MNPIRIVEFNVRGNHLHLITEASDRRALSTGVQGFVGRTARRLNALLGRQGKLFAERYHARYLKTPTEVRNAPRYVLLNRKHHAAEQKFSRMWIDPFSSAGSSELRSRSLDGVGAANDLRCACAAAEPAHKIALHAAISKLHSLPMRLALVLAACSACSHAAAAKAVSKPWLPSKPSQSQQAVAGADGRAQGTGSLQGVVMIGPVGKAQRAVGATVIVSSPRLGRDMRVGTTDVNGVYHFDDLPPGDDYDVAFYFDNQTDARDHLGIYPGVTMTLSEQLISSRPRFAQPGWNWCEPNGTSGICFP